MKNYRRYGVYVVPDGALYGAGAAWLGWDAQAGCACAHPDIAGLPDSVDALTAAPRKYGFHGTVKPPFALADGTDSRALAKATAAFCASQLSVTIPALEVRRLGAFVALIPTEPSDALADLAGAAVSALDPFRATATEGELARRRKAGLSTAQEVLLQRWGYPYVMEEFRFHMTLTGRTPHADAVRDALTAHFAPVLPTPFIVNSLALMGEDADGVFHLIHRYALTG